MWIAPELAQTVAAIVDEKSFDAAARRLRISPSAVSQRLRALESQLGRVLIIRSRPVRATAAGTTIVRLARQYEVIGHEASIALGLERRDRMHVPIAVNADSLSLWLLPALEAVAREHDVTFELLREDEDRTAALLESGSALAAITSEENPIAGCTVTPLGATEYVAFASPGFVDRWFARGATKTSIAAAPVIEFDRSDDLQAQWLRANGVDPEAPPRHYVPASEDYAAAVRLGMGWGMLPPAQAAAALERGSLVPLGAPDIDEPLFWQQWNITSPALAAIREFVVRGARAALRQQGAPQSVPRPSA
ncbi:LysR family transcriptional regulator ArgP [Microbacterium sp. JB110]|uniref:LysR family transcriptional regulator ArgP n=1 Tax=Microbacterium sp. JB110 TaxID=2024477 RepID=UPI00097F4DF4|nr:LysR family transcriptional regulator ArgP [Microbacterium sp. JB110]RCS60907.1 LysR family transcriptional regulator ArgP [Microbacterium sp. JB110]SJM64136.1 putative transcriptional regulator, LysR family [Frigoribacterium sp. JB110]